MQNNTKRMDSEMQNNTKSMDSQLTDAIHHQKLILEADIKRCDDDLKCVIHKLGVEMDKNRCLSKACESTLARDRMYTSARRLILHHVGGVEE